MSVATQGGISSAWKTHTDGDLLLFTGTSGGTSAAGTGAASASTAQTEWSVWDTGTTAGIRIDSSLHLGNASVSVMNTVDFQITLSQDAYFSINGNLNWLPNDFTVEAMRQTVALRDGLPPVPNYILREGDFLRSNLQNSLSINNVNESRGQNGDLLPFEPTPPFPSYGVPARIVPPSFLLPAGTYQLSWNHTIFEGNLKGLGSPGEADFAASGFLEFTLETPGVNTPESSTTVVLLGAGVIGMALAGRRFGQQNA